MRFKVRSAKAFERQKSMWHSTFLSKHRVHHRKSAKTLWGTLSFSQETEYYIEHLTDRLTPNLSTCLSQCRSKRRPEKLRKMSLLRSHTCRIGATAGETCPQATDHLMTRPLSRASIASSVLVLKPVFCIRFVI